MEQAILPVVIEQSAAPLFSEGVKTALIVAGGIVVVGACAAAAYMYVNRDKNPAVTEAQNLVAASLVQQLAEVSELRAAAMKKALAPALAAARKEYPNELLDNPLAALAAFNAGKN
jgi:hypothetical protein